jgi:uncharacterized protein (DUF427 family)
MHDADTRDPYKISVEVSTGSGSAWVLLSPNDIMKATWNGTTLAESDNTIVVEGNHYFPKDSIKTEYFQPSRTHTVCPWKGTASYYDIVVKGETNGDAAWYYPETKPEADDIKGYVAFWKGVQVTE